MKPARWHQIEHLYNQALEIEESRRASFLREACAGDDALRRELEQLLAEEPRAASFLEQPALREIAHEFAATATPDWIGRQIGNYQFVSLVGAGGMGEVYRARDTRLKRDVAIKILPEEFSRDPDRISRFQREAQVLASLNHPNIAAIHDLEEAGGFRFLILELVEGETLADRLKRGPIRLDDTLQIATQIAEGLAAAHDRGIVHRDLKPANIKLTPEGQAKVLDFGLAKAFAGKATDVNLSNSPTFVSGTGAGIVLGTAAYMSPEQAKGKEADRSSDVWAFGCVLYEMLTAKPVFTGETATEIMGRVLETEPNWDRLPAETPAVIQNLLRRCLQKERRSRLHDIADARIEIEEAQSGSRYKEREAVVSKRSVVGVAWIAALAVVLAGAFVGAGLYFRSTPEKTAEQRVAEISLPQTTASFAVSPDGRKLVFVATTEGQSRLWLRSLDSTTEAKPLAGTEGAQGSPFWSPDSQSIGFFARFGSRAGNVNTMNRIDVAGGAVQTVATPGVGVAAGSRMSGAWNQTGVIVFGPNVNTPLYRVPENGGQAVPVTRLDTPRQLVHLAPQFLPDGNHFLFYADGNAEGRGVYVGSLESREGRRLFDADGPAVFVPPEHLLFIRQGRLLAHRFDQRKLASLDEPFPVSPQAGSVSAAAGIIAYRTPTTVPAKVTWFDRTGKSLGTMGEELLRLSEHGSAVLAPDRKSLALHRTINANLDVWLLDMVRGASQPFTADPTVEGFPVWSPDSKRIVFNRNKGVGDGSALYVKSADLVGEEELLLPAAPGQRAFDWSPDGRSILIRLNRDIYTLPLTPDFKAAGKPAPLTNTNARVEEQEGRFSPDGRWIAYQSNESGRFEIYLQPFPGPGRKQPVSIGGGSEARWPRKGKELFYIAQDGKLMAVPVALSADGQRAAIGVATPIAPNLRILPGYVVSADGQSILMNAATGEQPNPPVTLILNWKPPGSPGK